MNLVKGNLLIISSSDHLFSISDLCRPLPSKAAIPWLQEVPFDLFPTSNSNFSLSFVIFFLNSHFDFPPWISLHSSKDFCSSFTVSSQRDYLWWSSHYLLRAYVYLKFQSPHNTQRFLSWLQLDKSIIRRNYFSSDTTFAFYHPNLIYYIFLISLQVTLIIY